MIRESVTTLQALLLGGITFAWGLRIGNKDAETFASFMMIVLSIILMAIS